MLRTFGACFLILCGLSPLAANDRLVVATPGFTHPVAEVVRRILPEACARLGLEVEFRLLPPARAALDFDRGEVDAFIFSDASFTLAHPGAVRVDTPVGHDEIVVFTRSTTINLDKGWESLRPYVIGYELGMYVVENGTRGMNREPAQNTEQLLRKLEAGREDVAVIPRSMGLATLRVLQYTDIRCLEPPLAKVPLYLFLTPHSGHNAYRISAALAAMERSGKIRAVTEKVLAEFLSGAAPAQP